MSGPGTSSVPSGELRSPRGPIVIVGAGMAGARAVATLRTEGFDGDVILVGDEAHRPYDRVPLSKNHLASEPGYHRLFVHDESFYADHDIDLRLSTRATAIDPSRHQVTLESGETIGFERLLLATGAEPRHLSVPGAHLDGVHELRTLDDAERLKATLARVDHVVVVGDGFIGAEVAASARQLGVDVTLIGTHPLPMERALGAQMAAYYRDLHLSHGVELVHSARVVALEGSSQVEQVLLEDGRRFRTDAVVVGIGALPRTGLAERAGLAIDNGVCADAYLATDAPEVFAAGDVANVWNPYLGRRLRLEHWSSALNQGPVAARNMLGIAMPYERIPFFFSDQYGVWMEYTGYAGLGDELVVRGEPGAGTHAEFVAFWLRKGRVTAGMNVNIKGVPDLIKKLITSGHRIDPATLADESVDLAEL